MLRLATITIFFCLPVLAFAYTPGVSTKEGVVVALPSSRNVYFGELKDEGAVFRFTLPEQDTIYLNLLTPKRVNKGKKFDVVVVSESEGRVVAVLDAGALPWEQYRDDLLAEDFLRGPELSLVASPGEYRIVVTSPGNTGRFALVIGNNERFSFSDMFALFQIAPELKREYFETSPISFLGSFVGIFFVITFIFFGVLLSLFAHRAGYAGRLMRWLFGKSEKTPLTHLIVAVATGAVSVSALLVALFSGWSMWLIVFSGCMLHFSWMNGVSVYRTFHRD